MPKQHSQKFFVSSTGGSFIKRFGPNKKQGANNKKG